MGEATRELATGQLESALERYEATGMVRSRATQDAAWTALEPSLHSADDLAAVASALNGR